MKKKEPATIPCKLRPWIHGELLRLGGELGGLTNQNYTISDTVEALWIYREKRRPKG